MILNILRSARGPRCCCAGNCKLYDYGYVAADHGCCQSHEVSVETRPGRLLLEYS
jgi:hypothetical protein